MPPSNGRARKKKQKSINQVIEEAAIIHSVPTLTHGSDSPPQNEGGTRAHSGNHSQHMPSPENNVGMGGTTTEQTIINAGSSSDGANLATHKVFVLPPHQRRSARASRSKYRRPANDDAGDNNGETSEIILGNPSLPNINESVRRFTKGAKGRRRNHNPASCRPAPGQGPLPIYWVNGVPVGDNAVKFACYCGEEARRYDRYPLHKRWNAQQSDYARSLYRVVLMKKHYIHFGDEDPEHEGHYLPVDQRAAERFIVLAVQDIKKDWRHTIKKDFFEPWEEADEETQTAIEEGLDPRIPKNMWPALCAYYSSPEKKAEAIRNAANRRSKKRLRPTCTTGRKRIMHVFWSLKKKQGGQFRAPGAFVYCHTKPGTENEYPDEDTRQYCEQMIEKSSHIPASSQASFSSICPITDEISGGHHGGYERGLGRVYSRKLQRAVEKSPIIAIPTPQYQAHESQELVALREQVIELKRKEEERERQQASLNNQQNHSTFTSGRTMDLPTFTSFTAQVVSRIDPAQTMNTTTVTSLVVEIVSQLGIKITGMPNGEGSTSQGENMGNVNRRNVRARFDGSGGSTSSRSRHANDEENRSSSWDGN